MQSKSNIEGILESLQKIGDKILDTPSIYQLKKPVFGRGVSQDAIASLRSLFKTPLPDDYVLFQTKCGSIEAMDIWNGYWVGDARHITSLTGESHLPHDVCGTSTHPITIPIGGDGGGNMFVVALGDSNHVSKWDHELNTQKKLANTFTEFLEYMISDWEHFIIQDDNWDYMAG